MKTWMNVRLIDSYEYRLELTDQHHKYIFDCQGMICRRFSFSVRSLTRVAINKTN